MNNPAKSGGTTAGAEPFFEPARERNLAAIEAFFKRGIKDSESQGRLGIELEHMVVRSDMSPVSYSEDHGVAWLLGQLAADYPTLTTDEEGDVLGVARPGESVTIEPASQLELSAGPFSSLADASRTFNEFEDKVNEMLRPYDKQLLPLGYHPSAAARSLELIPKKRYEFMNRYLSAKDTYGPCMMRGSGSTQVSIDYTSVEDCLRKLRLAYALVPLLSLMTDNSPVFEGRPREHKLVRTDIWRHVDNDRCGLIPGALDKSFTLRACAEYVLDTPAILVPCRKEQWCYEERTFGEVYADREMTPAEVEHAVSMFFPDVRLKTYVEIRPADAMPVPYVIAYAALIKGLFYCPESLNALEALFSEVDAEAYEQAKDALMADGYDAVVYGKPVAQLCDHVIALASSGLNADDRAYLAPLADLVSARTTLADKAEQQMQHRVD